MIKKYEYVPNRRAKRYIICINQKEVKKSFALGRAKEIAIELKSQKPSAEVEIKTEIIVGCILPIKR